jgi:photosystem II stability/assembly factor-like uncharacterized protein
VWKEREVNMARRGGTAVRFLVGAFAVALVIGGAGGPAAASGIGVKSATGRYLTPPLRHTEPATNPIPPEIGGDFVNQPTADVADPDAPPADPDAPPADPDAGTSANQPATADEQVAARANWLMRQRIYPYKKVPAAALPRARAQAARLPLVSPRRSSTVGPNVVGHWQSIGPAPIKPVSYSNTYYNGTPPWAGRVTSLAGDPTNANVMYLGSPFGGVWKTTNGGTTWNPVFDHAGSLAVGSIAVAASQPNTIYVGTGEGNGAVDSYIGNGVWKSTNGGANWTQVGGNRFNGCSIAKVIVSPANPNVVLVAVRNGTAELDSRNCPFNALGVQRSADGGQTWSQPLTQVEATDLAVSTTHPNVMYAAFEGGFVARSASNGASGSWQQLTSLPNPNTTSLGRTVLSTSADGTRVVVGFENPSNNALYQNHFYRSTNSGGNFGTVPVAIDFCKIGTFGQCFYDFALQIDPAAPGTFYALGIYAFRCTTSCVRIGSSGVVGNSPASIHVDNHAVTIDKSGRVWIGSDGGVYRSANHGGSFTNLNADLAITQFYPGISGNPGTAMAGGTQDNGSLRYTASNGAWREISEGDGGYTATDPTNANHQYVTYPFGIVYETANAGQVRPGQIDDFGNGTNICNVLQGDSCNFIFPLIADPQRNPGLFAGSRKLWRASVQNHQWIWHPSSTTFNTPLMAIAAVKRSTVGTTVVYAATTGDQGHQPQIRVSTDGGNTFAAAGAGLPNRFVTDIAVNPNNWKQAWAVVSGFGTGHIFKTTNGGQTWTSVNGNFPNTPVSAIAVDFRAATPVLYAGSDVGVLRSTNGGSNWARFGTGLPNSFVMDIVLYPNTNTLVAATHGRGVFKATISAP